MKLYVFLFVLMCVSQWYIPVSMIARQEDVLRTGKVFRFKTAPVDPSDAFRGKYITLDFQAEIFKHAGGQKWVRNAQIFAIVKSDKDGFAVITDITAEKPDAGADYFSAEVRFSDDEAVRLRFPFDRFYLEESKAAEAEKIYQESNANGADGGETYAIVRLKDGRTALIDVVINGRSLVGAAGESGGVP